MKRLLCVSAFAAFLFMIAIPGFAREDIRCWTSKDDAFYHIEKSCENADEAFPLSETAAMEFQKIPCSVCMEGKKAGDREERFQCSVRGGTYVVRVPDSMLERYFLLEDSEDPVTMPYDSGQLEAMSLMTDADHEDFRARVLLDGRAQGKYRSAEPVSDDSILGTNVRQIDGIWYLVARPKQAFSESDPFRWRIIENEISVNDDGVLSISRCGQMERESFLDIQTWNGAAPVFEIYYDWADIQIYRGLDANVAVIHERNANEQALTGELFIGNGAFGIGINGYMSDKNTATYCCVITEAELGRLVSLKTFSIRHEPEK